MNIIIEAPMYGQSGYEVLSRGIAISLDKLGVNVQIIQKEGWNKEKCVLDDEDYSRLVRMERKNLGKDSFHIMQQCPNDDYLRNKIYSMCKKSFCFSLFETNKCPAPWVNKLNMLSGTFVFSEHNYRAFLSSGVRNITKIPFGIDTKLFNPNITPINIGQQKDEYIFITNGDFTERKNFEGLIEAYVKEFTNKDKVCLIIKAHFGGFTKIHKDQCVRKIKEIVYRFNSINPPKILFLGDKIPSNEMPRFYTTGNCFILTSRGEGIGLPYAEALACGVPVIASGFGGQTEFLNEFNSILVKYDLKIIDDMEYIKKCLYALNHSWAYPSVGETRNSMRFAYEFRDIMKEKGLRGRSDMEKMTWKKTGLSIIKKLLEK